MRFVKRTVVVMALAAMALHEQRASAVVVNFESPTYAPGPLAGQDGWALNSYNGLIGGVNGQVTVATSSPLAGAQSVLYSQTGGGGGTDVSKLNILNVVRGGTAASDLTASVLLQATNNNNGAGRTGFFIGPDVFNGNSPVNVQLNQASTTAGTGTIEVAYGGGFQQVGTYTANNVMEFTFNVDFDNSVYTLFARDLTANTAPVQLGPVAGIPVFGSYGSTGDGQTFNVGAAAIFRSGAGMLDNISFTVVPEPASLAVAAIAGGAMVLRRRHRVI